MSVADEVGGAGWVLALVLAAVSLEVSWPEEEEKGSLSPNSSGNLGEGAGFSKLTSAFLKNVSWALVLVSEPGPVWSESRC